MTVPLTIVGVVDLTADVGGFEETAAGRSRRSRRPGDYRVIRPGRSTARRSSSRDGVDVDTWIERHHDAVTGVRLQNADTMAEGFKEFLDGLRHAPDVLRDDHALRRRVPDLPDAVDGGDRAHADVRHAARAGRVAQAGPTRRPASKPSRSASCRRSPGSSSASLLALGLLQLIGRPLRSRDPRARRSRRRGDHRGRSSASSITALSALVPAVRAGRLAPVEAMKGDYARDTRLGRAWIVGAVLFVCLDATVPRSSPSRAATSPSSASSSASVLARPAPAAPARDRCSGRITNRIGARRR